MSRIQQPRQLLQSAPDALPHAAAVSTLDPGDLGHRHAQVKPGVDTPGLDVGQLHQRGVHFLPQLLLLQDFLRGERPVEGIVFNAILPVQRVVGLMAYLSSVFLSWSHSSACVISFSSSASARAEFNSAFLAAGGHER